MSQWQGVIGLEVRGVECKMACAADGLTGETRLREEQRDSVLRQPVGGERWRAWTASPTSGAEARELRAGNDLVELPHKLTELLSSAPFEFKCSC